MSKKIRGLVGYNHKDIEWGVMDVLAEVSTDGEDQDGFEKQETLGVAKNEYGSLCLFVGSIESHEIFDSFSTITFSNQTSVVELPSILRRLADEINHD